jgi:hypothetical protein
MWQGALRRASKFEERDPRLTITLESLSEVLWRQSKYSNAEPLCKWTMQIYERTLGPNHPDVGIISTNLAMLYHAQRKYAEAEPLYKRALPIRTCCAPWVEPRKPIESSTWQPALQTADGPDLVRISKLLSPRKINCTNSTEARRCARRSAHRHRLWC